MCRLFAFSFQGNTGEEKRIRYINSFRELALSGAVLNRSVPGHLDGWGAAVYTDGVAVPSVYRSINRAVEDNAFQAEQFFMQGVTQAGIAHLRKKTIGEPSLSNTHPFVDGVYSFAHNGTITCEKELFPDIREECKGGTDSERLFRQFLKIKNEGSSSVFEAFRKLLLLTRESYPTYSAINTVLHDGGYLYASRIINKDNPDHSPEEVENYYTLYLGKTKNGDCIVSSEKFIDDEIEYTLLPNNSICVIDRETGKEEIISL